MITDPKESISPIIKWDKGTAYDFFTSLFVIHHPNDFGLRSTWAAGVRSRLSTTDRKILEDIVEMIDIPFGWIYNLPSPKDAFTAIYTIKTMDPATCLIDILCSSCEETLVTQTIRRVAASGKWSKEDITQVQTTLKNDFQKSLPAKKVETMLTLWTKSSEYGSKAPAIFQMYYYNFFLEEEERIKKAVDLTLSELQEKSKQLSWLELLEEASRGINFNEFVNLEEITLVPSYWTTPLVIHGQLHSKKDRIILFGARPLTESLIPGEAVPDDLLRALKSLSDPTRLQILRILSNQNLTQAEIAKKLRLRAPTITHHLHELRLAGLVGFDLTESSRYYKIRKTNLDNVFSQLDEYLQKR